MIWGPRGSHPAGIGAGVAAAGVRIIVGPAGSEAVPVTRRDSHSHRYGRPPALGRRAGTA